MCRDTEGRKISLRPYTATKRKEMSLPNFSLTKTGLSALYSGTEFMSF
jgi:hypothetical protein